MEGGSARGCRRVRARAGGREEAFIRRRCSKTGGAGGCACCFLPSFLVLSFSLVLLFLRGVNILEHRTSRKKTHFRSRVVFFSFVRLTYSVDAAPHRTIQRCVRIILPSSLPMLISHFWPPISPFRAPQYSGPRVIVRSTTTDSSSKGKSLPNSTPAFISGQAGCWNERMNERMN